MPRVRLYHWNAEEAKPLIKYLRDAGYMVDYDIKKGLEPPFGLLRKQPLHALVIDLTRLPSRGRNLAVAIRAQNTVRHLPIVFVDGVQEKIERIRAELPDAIFTSRARLATALKHAKPLANPTTPAYSTRTAAEKLGIRAGDRVAVIDAPPDYAKAIGELPPGASLEEEPQETLPVTLWFVRDREALLPALLHMRRLAAAKSRLAVIFRKQKVRGRPGSGFTVIFFRDCALEVGLNHYKTCSVDDAWSAALLRLRK